MRLLICIVKFVFDVMATSSDLEALAPILSSHTCLPNKNPPVSDLGTPALPGFCFEIWILFGFLSLVVCFFLDLASEYPPQH